MKTKKRLEIWNVVSIVLILAFAVFLLWPLMSIIKESVISDGSFTMRYFVKFFSQKYYFQTLFNSFKVSICATAVTLIVGIPLAYFCTMYEIKGKGILQILIILCCMSPPFIGAYSWILLLGRSGTITVFLEKLLGIDMPNIYGFKGILLVLSLQLFPLVYLYVAGALKNIDSTLLEAAENLGCSPAKKFFRVVLMLCMPSILAVGLLVFMRALSDFGTPLLIGEGYRTFTVEIYNQYLGEMGGSHNFAAAISVVAVIITGLVFFMQKYLSKKYSFAMSALHKPKRKKAKGFLNIIIHFYCYAVVLVAFLPQVYVIYTSFRRVSGKLFMPGFSFDSYILAWEKMRNSVPNTFIIGLIALFAVVVMGVFIAYLVVRRPGPLNHTIDTLSMVPYIIPGSVIGIALVTTFNERHGILPPLTGGIFIMVLALAVRRAPYSIRSSTAALQQISPSIEEAAISLGASKLKTFFGITVPMMSNGIVSGAILSWVNIITELSTAIILYNAKTITLTLAVYTFVTRGNYGAAAACSTVLTVLTGISLLIFNKISKNKDLVF